MSKNFWTIEEIELEDGNIGHRQTKLTFKNFKDGSWKWDCPEDRLDESCQEEWHRVMNLLKNVNGEDLRHLVCGTSLMDHCLNSSEYRKYAD
jgi:phage terminase small subunit